MPASPRKIPAYRLHKPTGQAVVTLNGRDFYLGRHGSPASRDEYDRLIAEWLVKYIDPAIESCQHIAWRDHQRMMFCANVRRHARRLGMLALRGVTYPIVTLKAQIERFDWLAGNVGHQCRNQTGINATAQKCA